VSGQALRILSLQGNPAFSLAQFLIGKITLLMGSLVFCSAFFRTICCSSGDFLNRLSG
jgi:hypothetical protein